MGVFTDGDVSTIDEYNAVDTDCGNGNQSPVVYDADGTITTALGLDERVVDGEEQERRGAGREVGEGRLHRGGAAARPGPVLDDQCPRGVEDSRDEIAFARQFGYPILQRGHSKVSEELVAAFEPFSPRAEALPGPALPCRRRRRAARGGAVAGSSGRGLPPPRSNCG